ncbi:hypothetical protein OBBRIDRAFT_739396 [Obba rivulosa]|uniref:Vacuolar protein sorting-associated protein 62 n=1 Tax=Obba rivulosa TaxID=1052685 RepID=A0A8E2AK85_9APHY|nr:hypothetical protein OBBRIDRAFT_739396 [Obba rivulosa]
MGAMIAVLFGLLYAFSFAGAGTVHLVKRDPIPDFVLEKAPLSHLWSQESWWPSDVAVHLTHVEPQVNFTAVTTAVTFENISTLPSSVFLTAVPSDAVLTQPSWLTSADNTPEANGVSGAPATIICVEKPGGIIDAFYFYFYSFNAGGTVLGIEFDNHVGDWEHSMVRFVNGIPEFIYLSAHTGGTAYTYDTLNTTNGRATTYIAGGTHANYATPGPHFHDLPPPLLADQTDNGALWDVTANFRGYWFDNTTQTFHGAGGAGVGATEQANEGVGWLMFEGMWGDQQYPLLVNDQYCIFDQCHFTDGPTGPIAKNLGRNAVCQRETNCTVLTSLS